MLNRTIDEQMNILKRGTIDLISEDELRAKLKLGKPLRVKAGFDPTSPDLHLGHTVVMQKLKQFQDLGHHIIFVVGDFTAMVGDPTGRNELRPQLTVSDVERNAKTYTDQAFKILDRQRTEVVFNSSWLGKMSVMEFARLGSKQTVARMLERDDFKKRLQAGGDVTLLEFYYPLLQAQDSVELKADVEMGGTDQLFNLLMGRTIQKRSSQSQQVVITMPLLVGTDGVQKMSKSYGNYIGIIDAPREMFGKMMSISDALMWDYYNLLSDRPSAEIASLQQDVVAGKMHPKLAKENLAIEIVARFHSAPEAQVAQQEFQRIFSAHGKPEEMELINVSAGTPLIKCVVAAEIVKSGGEFRRLVTQGGVELNDERIQDPQLTLSRGEHVLKLGKRKFFKLLVA